MTDGDVEAPVLLPRPAEPGESDTGGGRVADAVPIGSRSGGARAAVASVGAPPWLRVPIASEVVDLPARARLSATPAPGPDAPGSEIEFSARTPTASPSRPRPVAPMPRPPALHPGPSRPPVAPPSARRPPISRTRPQVVVEDGILGLSRLTRSRVGSRLFTLFFVAVFALILGELVYVLVHG